MSIPIATAATATPPAAVGVPTEDVTPAPVLFAYAHPDDEAFGSAGSIALLTGRGVPVVLVCATRGEAGEISDPRLATRETIGAVREAELRAAMAVVGVADIRLLGYRDSGMAGTAENDDPRAFVNAPLPEVVAQLAAQIRAVRPTTVVTFGPDGIYGHPDHIYTYRATAAAVEVAADPDQPTGLGEPWRVDALYFNAIPRERIEAMAERSDGPFRSMPPEERAKLGTPEAEIDTIVDVADLRERKVRAIRAHQTQVGEGGPMANLPPEQVAQFLSREFFRRAPLPWEVSAPGQDPLGVLARETAAVPAD